MKYLHTMVRVKDLDAALDFYVDKLGLVETRRFDNAAGKYTLVFLCAPEDAGRAEHDGAPTVELTYNWETEDYDGGRNFGHLAYEVDDIYALCRRLDDKGVTINRPPRDGRMAFVRSPDGISIELLQKGAAKPPAEPWTSMPNVGVW
jgi:lactoylglutathione lyase